jgi:hypothetical protein
LGPFLAGRLGKGAPAASFVALMMMFVLGVGRTDAPRIRFALSRFSSSEVPAQLTAHGGYRAVSHFLRRQEPALVQVIDLLRRAADFGADFLGAPKDIVVLWA